MNNNYSKPINILIEKETTIMELATITRNKINPLLSIKKLPLPDDDPQKRKPDLSIAKNVLHWAANTDIDTGLDSTISYLQETY